MTSRSNFRSTTTTPDCVDLYLVQELLKRMKTLVNPVFEKGSLILDFLLMDLMISGER